MIEKKSVTRFTIQFSQTDPEHVHIAEILNAQGRKKARLIVDAILFYEKSNGKPVPQKPPIDVKTIEAVVIRLLEKKDKEKDGHHLEPAPSSLKPHTDTKPIQCEDVLDLDSDSINAIADALSAFRME